MKTKTKGFIQIPILVWVLIGILTIGGTGYGVIKYQRSRVDDTQKDEAIENLSREIVELKNQQATTANDMAATKNPPTITERIIEKTIVVESKTTATSSLPQIPASTPSSMSSDTKKLERQAFDTFWANSQKATNELNEATKYITSALASASGSTESIASMYAQNAIDACNSAYQLNLANTIPNLPFNGDLKTVNQIIGDLGAKCKLMAQAYQESFKYSTDIHSDNYNPYKASDLAKQGKSLMDEFFSMWNNQLTPASNKVVNDANSYF